MSADRTLDLVVVGGGPAGATLATLVAMRGFKVMLLERERFPRYQIGESLLPSTVQGICRLLGVHDEVASAGFMPKRGGSFRWGRRPEPWTFDFSTQIQAAVGADQPLAYQVERARFDAILLENAGRKGVEVVEEATVVAVVEDGPRVTGVRFKDRHGKEHFVSSRFVGDASGNSSRLCGHVGQRRFSHYFQNVALYGYFEGGRRLPAPNSGNILCAAFDQGWFWYIPLSERLTSVGAVVGREHARALGARNLEPALSRFIERCPIVAEYLAGARRVTDGIYGKLRTRKDYSYTTDAFWRPGMFLVGDAACFIDPLFSSGVHLATFAALLAARSVNTVLEGRLAEDRCFAEFDRRYRREFKVFYDLLISLYDMNQEESSYFWEARKLLNTTEQNNHAFVRLVAGAGTAPEEFFRIRNTLGHGMQLHVDNREQGRPYNNPTVIRELLQAFGRYPVREAWTTPGGEKEVLHQALGLSPVDGALLGRDLVAGGRDGMEWLPADG
jgi:FAD-dependent halogenase